MTVQILKSQIHDEAAFRDALEKLRQAKIDHAMSGEVGTAPPTDPSLEAFLTRTPTGPDTPDDYVIDVEIINDDPSPEELKARALHELRMQEQAEIEAVLPQHKRRLFEMDALLLQARVMADQVAGKTQVSAEDEKALAEVKGITDAITAIQYAYAQREAEL